MAALPVFSPFNQPQGVIFPQHCDLLVVQVNVFRNAADLNAGVVTGIPAITESDLGYPYTPSGIYGAHDVTEAVPAGINSALDQSPVDLTLSTGLSVVAEGVAPLTGAIVKNLVGWTTGPAYETGVSATPTMQVRGYSFVNLSLLSSAYGVGTVGKPNICNINFTCGLYSLVQCWAEAIPHCRTAAFGSPNSLSHLGGVTQETAPPMGWSTAHQAVAGYCKGVSVPPTTGGNSEITPVVGITAYKSGTHYVVGMSNSGFGTNTFGTTIGSGSD